MIDPQEVLIQFLLGDVELADLVGTRIATKHRYGVAWVNGTASLVVRMDGGQANLYVPIQTPRIEVDCYAGSQKAAMAIWMRLVEISRETERAIVTTSGGDALLHYFLQASPASMLYDDEVKMDMVMAFFNAMIGEGKLA